MKKKIVHCLLLGMAVLGLSGCSSDENHGLSKKAPTVITVWSYYNGAQKIIFDEKIQEFNDTLGRDMGIVVDHSSKGSINELSQAVEDSVEGKAGSDHLPDIFAAYADTAYYINQKGMAADLSQYLTSEEIDEYVDAYMEEGRFIQDGSLKLFPIAKSTEVLALNDTDWTKFSKDTGASETEFATWEGIARLAKMYYEWSDNLTETPDDGKAFFGRDAFANYILIGSMQLGHEIFKVEDGEAQLDFDKATMRRLWDNYYIPYVNGYYGSYGKFRSDDLKTGNLLACIGSTSSIAYLPSTVELEDGTKYEIESRLYPTPNFQGTEPYAVQQGAGMLVVVSEEKREYAATTFLKWFTDIENNIEFSLASGYLPVKKNVNKEAIQEVLSVNGEPFSKLLQESADIGMDITSSYHLYTPKAFKHGDKARKILNTSMDQKAAKDCELVNQRVQSGMTRDEAVKPFFTDDNFEQWYENTKEQLLAIGD